MSRSRVERVERERLSGRRRVNVARVITPLPPLLDLSLPLTMPSRSLTVSFPLSRSPFLSIRLSVSPSFSSTLIVTPLSLSYPRRNNSLAYDTTRSSLAGSLLSRLSRPFISRLSSRLTSRLPTRCGLLYSTAPSSIRRCFSPPFPSLCAHVYRCKLLSISRAQGC